MGRMVRMEAAQLRPLDNHSQTDKKSQARQGLAHRVCIMGAILREERDSAHRLRCPEDGLHGVDTSQPTKTNGKKGARSCLKGVFRSKLFIFITAFLPPTWHVRFLKLKLYLK